MIATTMMIRIKAPMLMLMLRFMAGPPDNFRFSLTRVPAASFRCRPQ
jgi:hypothetical protein